MKIASPRHTTKSRANIELFSTSSPWLRMMKMRVPSTIKLAPTPKPMKKYSSFDVYSCWAARRRNCLASLLSSSLF